MTEKELVGDHREAIQTASNSRTILDRRDPHYDCLFEPLDTGPVTAKKPLLSGSTLQWRWLSRPNGFCPHA